MAIKKVVRKHFGAGASMSRGREQSPLRPRHAEKKAPCAHACPSGNRIRQFVTTIAQAERLGKSPDQALEEAWYAYTETSPLPAVCGRVCAAICESQCNRKDLDGAVSVNHIERAIGDFGIEKGLKLKMLTDQKRPQRIAVVGAGPSGLSCAYQLARRGYGVTVFEALEAPGGMLRRGIAGGRLPEPVLDAEISKILDLGVELHCGVRVDPQTGLEELRQSYDAVYVALGSQQDDRAGVEGESASKVAPGVMVTMAVGRGRRAAEATERGFLGTPRHAEAMPVIRADRLRLDHYEKKSRNEPPTPDIGLTRDQVIEESRRCMSCGYCFDCEKCWLFCQDQAVSKPLQKGVLYTFKLESCTGCKKCAEECPSGFIDML